MTAVAVQELSVNLRRYLERVAQGETLEVIDHGRPVALLSPAPETAVARLRREGRVIPARLNLLDLGPPLPSPGPLSASQALEELRADD